MVLYLVFNIINVLLYFVEHLLSRYNFNLKANCDLFIIDLRFLENLKQYLYIINHWHCFCIFIKITEISLNNNNKKQYNF